MPQVVERLRDAGVDDQQLDVAMFSRLEKWCSHLMLPEDEMTDMPLRVLFDLLDGRPVESISFEPSVEAAVADGHTKLRAAWRPKETYIDAADI